MGFWGKQVTISGWARPARKGVRGWGMATPLPMPVDVSLSRSMSVSCSSDFSGAASPGTHSAADARISSTVTPERPVYAPPRRMADNKVSGVGFSSAAAGPVFGRVNGRLRAAAHFFKTWTSNDQFAPLFCTGIRPCRTQRSRVLTGRSRLRAMSFISSFMG